MRVSIKPVPPDYYGVSLEAALAQGFFIPVNPRGLSVYCPRCKWAQCNADMARYCAYGCGPMAPIGEYTGDALGV